jgi:hypothetical protein
MASKRFTDSKKWRNEWFRTLKTEAKLAWIYICDECEFHGVIKMDYGLASFKSLVNSSTQRKSRPKLDNLIQSKTERNSSVIDTAD